MSDALAGATSRLEAGLPLDEDGARDAIGALLSGAASTAGISAFLRAERAVSDRLGISADLLAGAARAMRAACVPVSPRRRPLLDTCGTGGDGLGLLNLSTAAALVAASCGAAVAKHGNRSASSPTGSADLVEALGLPLGTDPLRAADAIDRTGFAFLFAPAFHPALARAAEARRAVGTRTLFNLLGPLCHPASAELQLLGVPGPALLAPMAEALRRLGVRRALVLSCDNGADELLPGEGHRAALVSSTGAVELRLAPPGESRLDALRGGSPRENARRVEALLSGGEDPAAEAVALNAGAALALGREGLDARSLPDAIEDGRARARTAMTQGRAREFLHVLRRAS